MRRTHPRLSVGRVCRWLGRSRQSFYCAEARERCRQTERELIVKFVREARAAAGHKIGTKKLRRLIAEPLARAHIRCGRDRLYRILRAEGMPIKPKRSRRPSTTDPSGWRGHWPDLREGLWARGTVVLQPERLWVADITYVRLASSSSRPAGAFCYAHLITDAYSRKIVGAYVGLTMHATETLKALRRALATRSYPERRLCHHSDRGSQYRAEIYTLTLAATGASVSMTQDGCPYDNALAESVNGQLKTEYGLDGEFANVEAVRYPLGQAVAKYNHRRPHGSLGMATPAAVHAGPEDHERFAMAWGKLPPLDAAAAADNQIPDAAARMTTENRNSNRRCQSIPESLHPL